jgi:hypothetical protein
MPAFGAEAPLYLYGIPAEQRGSRCIQESDTCIVDQTYFSFAAVWKFRCTAKPSRSAGESGLAQQKQLR